MMGIGALEKGARRKIMGPVLIEFSAQYMEARKAIRGGQDPKTFKFDRKWEVGQPRAVPNTNLTLLQTLAKGKAPERRPNPPTMDLTRVIKKKVNILMGRTTIADAEAQKPQQEPGPNKPAASQVRIKPGLTTLISHTSQSNTPVKPRPRKLR